MGVCRVHACLQGSILAFKCLRGLAPDHLAKQVQNKV